MQKVTPVVTELKTAYDEAYAIQEPTQVDNSEHYNSDEIDLEELSDGEILNEDEPAAKKQKNRTFTNCRK